VRVGSAHGGHCRWCLHYGGIQVEEAKPLTQLAKENARLKKLLAEAELEKAVHKELADYF
jgi:putative transposase